MAARDKKPRASGEGAAPPADPPRLTQSGRVVKSRLSAEPEPEAAKRPKPAQAAPPAPAASRPGLVVGKTGRRRGRPVKARFAPKKPPEEEPQAVQTRNRRRLDGEAPEGADDAESDKRRPPPIAKGKPRGKKGPKPKLRPQPKPEKDPEPERSETAVPPPSPSPVPPPASTPVLLEIKKEPEPAESPLAAFDSRSSSPRNPRKRRTSSDLLLVMNQQQDANSASARSESPFPASPPAHKSLRNGKRRSLKDTLLNETVEQEIKKRKRIASVSPDAKPAETPEEEKAPKRRRSEDDGEPVDGTVASASADEETEAAAEPIGPDEKLKDDSDASTRTETAEGDCADGSPAKNGEKITEKTLILDNMSKAFNDASLGDKTKNIRRSTRQRKSTTKAKEQEESSPADKDSDSKSVLDIKPDDTDVSDRSSVDVSAEASANSKLENCLSETADDCIDKIDDSLKENIQNSSYVKPYTDQDFDKLIDRLKCLEEQDRKRQEEISKLNSRSVMVTSDVVLIPKSNIDKALKDLPNSVILEKAKEKENVLNCLETNSSISIVKKEQIRRSFDIDLPSSVTLIKRSVSRKHSAGSNSRDGDSVTMIDKSLGKEVTLDIRKSIDKGILTIEPSKPMQNHTNGPQSSAKPLKSSNRDYDKNSEYESFKPLGERRGSLEIISLPSAASVLGKMRPDLLDGIHLGAEIISETPEKQKEKEAVLKTLGLLTLEAANQAKIDKQKQKEMIKSNKTVIPKYSSSEGYTGTLKTVIKLNRANPDKKKGRTPLKMTFQKSKNRGNKFVDISGDSESDESPYYTIHKEFGGSSGSGTGSSDNHMTSGGHRKTHYSNRFNNHESGPQDALNDIVTETPSSKEAAANLVIPEKASSFGIHPGRLCQDQCFYCGGKFGLFDTPCHIAQIKSSERQKKILDNEEKLTVDSCLCDACYRHVDRRANCPSYRKRAGPGSLPLLTPNAGVGDLCYVNSCGRPAPHTLRRKWLVKMRKSISKVVQLDLDYPGLHTIPLCDMHYQTVTQLMICSLCKRRLSRNHVHYINQDKILNPLLHKQGIPVVFEEKPVVCKSCRYFCTLLLRPPSSSELNKLAFLKSHHRRLVQAHNVTLPDDSDTDYTDEPSATQGMENDQKDASKDKKRGKNVKNKNKKTIENKLSDENSLGHAQHRNNNNKGNSLEIIAENIPSSKVILEDMESLISSNKILVSGMGSTISGQTTGVSTMSINDSDVIEYDNPLIAELDKRSELHNSLQKWNVPSTTILHLNSKSTNILKVRNSAISNKSQGQRKLNRNEKRIQKLGQIITHKTDFEESLGTKIPNREEFTIEPMNADDRNGRDTNNILRNIALNDECTIETIPPKTGKNSLDINSLKSKWVNTESFSQVKRNLNALSKNHTVQKKGINQSDYNFSNPVHRLETNPSISVRELFPGEEEMNLQCNIEFGNVKGVTPEGWEKCNTTIQYDNETKNLWHELQKPYGNQSSFLRHLILLEKYFRNGDLILSQYANCNAITYSESVQNRLRSYDNLPTNGDVSANCSMNSNLSKTTHNITNTVTSDSECSRNYDFRKPTVNIGAGKSLLKSNQNNNSELNKIGKVIANINKNGNGATTVNNGKNSSSQNTEQDSVISKHPKPTPVILTQLEKLGNQLTPIQVPITPRPPTPRPDIPKMANEILRVPSLPPTASTDTKTATPKTEVATNKSKASSLPPELIAISQTTLHKKNIENVVKSIHLKGSSTPVNPATQPPVSLSSSFPSMSPIAGSSQTKPIKVTPLSSKDIVKKKGKGSTKHWRPTLIPITDESTARNGRDVLHQTADGRRLPSLVQVLSGGKPYYITIQDYNRMCIMRREKLQQENLKKESQKKNQSNAQTASSTPNTTDTSVDSTSIVLAENQTKPASPVAEEIEKPVTPTPKPSEPIVNSTPEITTVPKAEESVSVTDVSSKNVLTDVDTSSLLKSVTLKNVTIAPITSSVESKPTPITNTPQSLLITSAKSIMQVPSIIGQLNSSVSVTAETIINKDAGATSPKAQPAASQAMTMPKIPKSLTVIPQTVNSSSTASSPPASVTPAAEPLSVLPLPAPCSVIPPAVTVSPSEP